MSFAFITDKHGLFIFSFIINIIDAIIIISLLEYITTI